MQVIVQGLPFAYAWQDLKDLFKPVGGVLKADIVMGPDGRSKGWGTVNFETEADAEKAIKVGPPSPWTHSTLTDLACAHKQMPEVCGALGVVVVVC